MQCVLCGACRCKVFYQKFMFCVNFLKNSQTSAKFSKLHQAKFGFHAQKLLVWIFSKAFLRLVKSFGLSFSSSAKTPLASSLAWGNLTFFSLSLIPGQNSLPMTCKLFAVALSLSCLSRTKMSGRMTVTPRLLV